MGGDAGRPRYVAIITDGNGRWAKRNGVSVAAGHDARLVVGASAILLTAMATFSLQWL